MCVCVRESPSALENERDVGVGGGRGGRGNEALRVRGGREGRDGRGESERWRRAAITDGREEEDSGGRTRGEGSMPVARTTTVPDLPSIHPGAEYFSLDLTPRASKGREKGANRGPGGAPLREEPRERRKGLA